tara:strand:+ start:13301 stop:13738 length:438 start_codon:yes stop_codon:yes gene_type:complete
MSTELSDISSELKGIRNILASMWHSRYKDGETDQVSPEIYADEYISTEECARRLAVSDQTIRNWILQGKKGTGYGWTQGVHYITIPVGPRKQIIRIPWNHLILSFAKGEEITLRSFDKNGSKLYSRKARPDLDNVPNPNVPDVDD